MGKGDCSGTNPPTVEESALPTHICGGEQQPRGVNKTRQIACAAVQYTKNIFGIMPVDRWIELALAFAIALAALTQCSVSNRQWNAMVKSNEITRDSLVANTRAWVTPTGAYFDGEPKVGLNQRVKITYENVGREAASDVVITNAWGPTFPVTIRGQSTLFVTIIRLASSIVALFILLQKKNGLHMASTTTRISRKMFSTGKSSSPFLAASSTGVP